MTEYLSYQYSFVLCDSTKRAIQKHNKEDYKKPTIQEIEANLDRGGNVGVLTGSRSENLEILDFDLKNAKNPKEWYENFIDILKLKISEEFVKQFVIQRSPSGGYHWLYFCEAVEGNKKISKGENKQAIVETRGEGGYFLVNPSKGYEFIRGDLNSVPVILPKHRQIMFEVAESLSEYTEPVIDRRKVKQSAITNEYRGKDGEISYWDVFNEQCDYLTLLEEDGWSIMKRKGDRYLLRRPEKTDDSWSADLYLQHEYGQLLYIYTTSTILEAEHAYLPSTYLIDYRYNGDGVRAYDYLIEKGYAPPRKQPEVVKSMEQAPETPEDADTVFSKYESLRIDETTEVEVPVPIITVNDVGLLHTGELLTISGESKSGKSGVVSAIIAKVINENADGFDIIKTQKTDLPILHFDTEQPRHRHKDNLKWAILKRTGLSHLPKQLMSYNLRKMSVSERKLAVSELVESARIRYGGVFLVIIDGIADFVMDTNDNKESSSIVEWMLQMSTEYTCGVINIIHINPSQDGYVKQRGHLGSELQRKTDSMVVVKKEVSDNSEQSVFYAHMLRNGGVFEFGKHYIYYDAETNMHQLAKESGIDVGMSEIDRIRSHAKQCIGKTMIEACNSLVQYSDVKDLKKAQLRIKELLQFNYLQMGMNSTYEAGKSLLNKIEP